LSFFVVPSVKRVTLPSDPNAWIELKCELSVSEQKKMEGALVTTGQQSADGTTPAFGVDAWAYYLARLSAYVVAWNFTDPDDRPVPVSVGTLSALRTEIAEEMTRLIDEHIAAQEAERRTIPFPNRSKRRSQS
jgi:hypothetical protein